jgi:hypothetical protein
MPAYLDRAHRINEQIKRDAVSCSSGLGVTAQEACNSLAVAFGVKLPGWECEYCETRNERGARCMECGAPKKV